MFLQEIVYTGNEEQADFTLLNEKLRGAFWHSQITLEWSCTVLERNRQRVFNRALRVLLPAALQHRQRWAGRAAQLRPARPCPAGHCPRRGSGAQRHRERQAAAAAPGLAQVGPSLTGAGAARAEVGLLVGAGAARRGPSPVRRRLLAPVQVAAAGDVGRAGHPGAQLRAAAEGPGARAQFVAADPTVAEAVEAVGAPRVHGGGG